MLLTLTGLLPQAAGAEFARPTVRIVLVGDSTVATNHGWGPAFRALLRPEAECLDLAANGRSSKSFRTEGRWKKALATHPDWILIQFGHNDMPGKGPDRETDPRTTYREFMSQYVDEARAIGARPILVTSVTRRNFDAHGKIKDDLKPYADAVIALAAEKHVPLIDLHARSIAQVEALGPAAATIMDAPTKDPAKPDRTHFSQRGGEIIAGLVAEELRTAAPELARYLR